MSGGIDVDKMDRIKKELPVGSCLEINAEINGEKEGMRICRVNETDVEFESTDTLSEDQMKGSVRIVKREEK